MAKRPGAASITWPRTGRRTWTAVLALAAFGACATQAAAQQAPALFLNICHQVKEPVASQQCQDAIAQDAKGNPSAAYALLKRAVLASPKDGGLRLMLGYHLLGLGGPALAERELRQARALGVPEAAVLPPLVRALLAQNQQEKLLKEFPEPAPDARGDAAAQILRARALALRYLGKTDEAAAQMDRSLNLRRDPVVLTERAALALQQNDAVLANKLIDEALKLEPDNAVALVTVLGQSDLSGDTATTLALSARILALYPNNIDARLARVRAFLKLQQDGQAKAEVDAVLTRSPDQVLGIYYRAVLLSRAKKNREAFQTIKGLPAYFIKTYPSLALPMAQIAFDNGNANTGADILSAALSASPGMLDVRLKLAAYDISQKNPQSAMLLLNQVQGTPDPRITELAAQAQQMIDRQRQTY